MSRPSVRGSISAKTGVNPFWITDDMSDIHVSGEQEFVCLEAANSKWQALPAGKTITISQEIKISRL